MSIYTICPTCNRLNLHAGGCKLICFSETMIRTYFSTLIMDIVLKELRNSS